MFIESLSQLCPLVQADSAAIIDPLLLGRIRDHLPPKTVLLNAPVGEEGKRIEVATSLWEELHAAGITRSATLIAAGGGALLDLAGFVAGCYLRGIDLILIPTTLLAMCDAAIGGKSGINLGRGKNLVGLIRKPKATVIDPSLLSTLPKEEIASGMAEVIKAAIIGDPDLFDWLEKDVPPLDACIRRAIDVKLNIVALDEREESGERALLNLGHTFAHAIETLTGYQRFRHGEAVAIGMSAASRLGVELLGAPADLPSRVDRTLQRHHLPTKLPSDLDPGAIVNLMRGDKKQPSNAKGITLILPRNIGNVQRLDNVETAPIVRSLAR